MTLNPIELDKLEPEQISTAIPLIQIKSKTKVWFMRTGRGAKYWDDFWINKYIGVNRENVPEFIPDKDAPLELHEIQKIYRDQIYQHSIEDLTDDEIVEKKKSLTSSAGRRAGVLRVFRHEMQKGDLILAPGKGTKKFLLGIITSDSIINPNLEHKLMEFEYKQSPFDNIRHVSWLKKLDFSAIPTEVKFIRHGNGSIFEVTEYIKELLPLFFNFYQYKGTVNARIAVTTTQAVTTDDLLELQNVIAITKNDPHILIEQKTKIESPGHLLLSTLTDNLDSLLTILNSFGLTGGVVFALTHPDKIAEFLAIFRDWKHTKNMNNLEEAAKEIELLQSIDTSTLNPKEKLELHQKQIAVTKRFQITNKGAGEDINDADL